MPRAAETRIALIRLSAVSTFAKTTNLCSCSNVSKCGDITAENRLPHGARIPVLSAARRKKILRPLKSELSAHIQDETSRYWIKTQSASERGCSKNTADGKIFLHRAANVPSLI